MATVFWDIYGVLLVDFTLPSSTVNAAVYQETKETQRAVQEKRPGLLTTVLLLHNNAEP